MMIDSKIRDSIRKQAPRLIIDGLSGEQVAEIAGVSPSRVSQWLRQDTGFTIQQLRNRNGWIGQIPPNVVQKICDTYSTNPNISPFELSSQSGAPIEMVRQVISKNGWTVRYSQQPRYDFAEEIVRQYVENFISTTTLAEQYSIHESTVRKILEKNGVPRRGRGKTLPVKRVIDDYVNSGLNLDQLTQKYGVKRKYMYGFLLRNGLLNEKPISLKNSDFSEEEIDSFIEDYCAGILTVGEIQVKHNISYRTCMKILKSNNVKLRTSGRQKIFNGSDNILDTFDSSEVIDAYMNPDLTINQIAAKFGVSNVTLRHWLRKNDVPVRKPYRHRRK